MSEYPQIPPSTTISTWFPNSDIHTYIDKFIATNMLDVNVRQDLYHLSLVNRYGYFHYRPFLEGHPKYSTLHIKTAEDVHTLTTGIKRACTQCGGYHAQGGRCVNLYAHITKLVTDFPCFVKSDSDIADDGLQAGLGTEEQDLIHVPSRRRCMCCLKRMEFTEAAYKREVGKQTDILRFQLLADTLPYPSLTLTGNTLLRKTKMSGTPTDLSLTMVSYMHDTDSLWCC